jgi:hypothetical protein
VTKCIRITAPTHTHLDAQILLNLALPTRSYLRLFVVSLPSRISPSYVHRHEVRTHSLIHPESLHSASNVLEYEPLWPHQVSSKLRPPPLETSVSKLAGYPLAYLDPLRIGSWVQAPWCTPFCPPRFPANLHIRSHASAFASPTSRVPHAAHHRNHRTDPASRIIYAYIYIYNIYIYIHKSQLARRLAVTLPQTNLDPAHHCLCLTSSGVL